MLAFALSREVLALGAVWSLLIGQAVEVSYLLGASAADETKTFDVAMVVFFFAGQVCALADSIELFVNYAPGWLYASCAAVAAIPQLFGAEPFTEYWMRQAYPAWLQRGAGFARIANRVSAAWAIVFVALAGISFYSPVGTATLWPAYVFVLGVMVPALSAIYPSSRIHKAGLKPRRQKISSLGCHFCSTNVGLRLAISRSSSSYPEPNPAVTTSRFATVYV